MTQGPKHPSRPLALRFRGKTPCYQRPDADEGTGHPALLGFTRLLARQAAREAFNDDNSPTGTLTPPEQ